MRIPIVYLSFFSLMAYAGQLNGPVAAVSTSRVGTEIEAELKSKGFDNFESIKQTQAFYCVGCFEYAITFQNDKGSAAIRKVRTRLGEHGYEVKRVDSIQE